MNIDPNIPPNHGQPPAPTVTPPLHYTDGYGIASIIMAAMFLSIPGLIVGIIGENKAKNNHASPILSRIGWIANLLMLVFSIIISVVLVSFVLQHADEMKSEFTNQSMNDHMKKTLYAETFTIRAPDDFVDQSSNNPEAAMAVGNDTDTLHLLAYTDKTVDIADGTTLARYADKAYETFTKDTNFSGQKREQLALGTIANPDKLEVVDYKMEANSGINKYIYYDRYIKTVHGFYLLTTWTSPGKVDENLPTMKSIIASFKESSSLSQ